jgi:hypothetical protein
MEPHQGLCGIPNAPPEQPETGDMTLPALKDGVSSFCKVWILCVSIPQTNKTTPGPNTLKLLRVSGFLGMDPLANHEKAAGLRIAQSLLQSGITTSDKKHLLS